ncbi:hypothetical protein MGYG_03818 [Nannizzia gypsea CBS 118893]|uniref:Uncharacterized protein n=1 Tax=Arthroderma gypseum (strain ATCC MYA-4604 / CBS 118893) TaxID=535722 RepID=E4UU47_ARTGP|nr:hypothetical protein MGYG_03818 [Nannizzia gypsea CBS 118893]EFR00814.1 hypothetical protein MGYG_03818 [Nannizzia gypsea CBS 118893]
MGGKFSSRLGWLQVPSLILGSWLVGLALAISHHLFYALLNDRLTAADSNIKLLGTSISEQQFNIALGTVFAFLTKAAFVLAVSTTYYQAAWWAVKRRSQPNKTQTLAEVDSVFAAAGDIISLLSSKFWYRYPLLFVLALPICNVVGASQLKPEDGAGGRRDG